MDSSSFLALLYNMTLLLTMALIFDLVTERWHGQRRLWQQVVLGVVLGTVAMAVMLTPWVYLPGQVFDTRSVLLATAGLFFGTIPTLIAMVMAALLRLYQGGFAAPTGVLVITLTGMIGLAWRAWRRGDLADIGARELYAFGVVAHVGMLLAMLNLGWEAAQRVYATVGVPVMVIYPLATLLMGLLLANRLRRDRADERVRASEAELRGIIENMPLPLATSDRSDHILYLNPKHQETFGYAADEIPTVGRWMEKAYPDPQYREQLAENWARLLAKARELGTEVTTPDCQVTCADGTVRAVDITMVPMAQFDVVIFQDMTAQKRSAAKLREQAELLDKAQDAIAVYDLAQCVRYWNRGAERLYGWKGDEALGRRMGDLLHYAPEAVAHMQEQVMAHGEWSGELHPLARDGRELVVETRLTLLRDDRGAPVSVLAIQTDVTERRVLEAQFLRAQRMESLGTLAGGIAHDLNNVLAPILLAVGMLKHQARTDQELRMLNILEGSAQRGADMVRQVLTFVRGAEGARRPMKMGELVADVAKLIRETFARNIELQVTIAADEWAIEGDATQLNQAILNLCVNARDAMPDGGRLQIEVANCELDEAEAARVGLAVAGRYVCVTVADTGTGIPEVIRARIFDPFFTTKELGKGTGLGLFTVMAVVKNHGGVVQVQSAVGQGSAFQVYLPVAAAAAAQIPSGGDAPLVRGHGEWVLVVDDEPAVREITQATLEAFGYHVLVAEDGAAALRLYATRGAEIAVVLTDMMMPGMDGYAVIQGLLQLDPQVKVIAASGLAAQGMAARAAQLGVTRFLPKPYSTPEMLNLLAKTLAEPVA